MALTCSGEEVVTVFVKGHGHDAVCQVKGLLDAVAVVDIDVDVQNPGVVPESKPRIKMWTKTDVQRDMQTEADAYLRSSRMLMTMSFT